MIGIFRRRVSATYTAVKVCIGRGMKQIATPEPNAGGDPTTVQGPQLRIRNAIAEHPQLPAMLAVMYRANIA